MCQKTPSLLAQRRVIVIEEVKKVVYYSTMIINMVAKKLNISIMEAFKYLDENKGMEFLEKHYEINHTLNSEDVVDDLIAICERGGKLT